MSDGQIWPDQTSDIAWEYALFCFTANSTSRQPLHLAKSCTKKPSFLSMRSKLGDDLPLESSDYYFGPLLVKDGFFCTRPTGAEKGGWWQLTGRTAVFGPRFTSKSATPGGWWGALLPDMPHYIRQRGTIAEHLQWISGRSSIFTLLSPY